MNKTYHVYLKDEVLFKDLNEEEFDVIWGRLFHSYYREELSYSLIEDTDNTKELDLEPSY
jgi:hypothetical protein|tara:strand:- start:434 stop:613 length:180 start_codon:yes stop_codon:yes gene_type:complete